MCLTLSPELIFDSFYASVHLNEVVDDLGSFLILQLSLIDATNVEQVFQLWV